jgi:hypothetical protein
MMVKMHLSNVNPGDCSYISNIMKMPLFEGQPHHAISHQLVLREDECEPILIFNHIGL